MKVILIASIRLEEMKKAGCYRIKRKGNAAIS